MSKKIIDIDPIEKPIIAIPTKKELKYIIESPLLRTCLLLYKKNILTYMSSANRKNVNNYAFLSFPIFEYLNSLITRKVLSDENFDVIQKIKKENINNFGIPCYEGEGIVYLFYPVTEHTTKIEVSDYFYNMTLPFKVQDIMMGIWNIEYMKEYYRNYYGFDSIGLTCEDIANRFGFIIQGNLVYETEEVLRRHVNYLKLIK